MAEARPAKVYVKVKVVFTEDGQMRPRAFEWEDAGFMRLTASRTSSRRQHSAAVDRVIGTRLWYEVRNDSCFSSATPL